MCDFFSGLTLKLCLAGLLGEAALPTPDMVHSKALQFLKGDEGPRVPWSRQADAWLCFLPAHLHPEAFLPGPGEAFFFTMTQYFSSLSPSSPSSPDSPTAWKDRKCLWIFGSDIIPVGLHYLTLAWCCSERVSTQIINKQSIVRNKRECDSSHTED